MSTQPDAGGPSDPNDDRHDDPHDDTIDDPGRPSPILEEIRTPRAAAIAGIAFALILGAVVILLYLALPAAEVRFQWITDDSRRQKVSLAMGLTPYAGIAFLWFIGVIRSRLGRREDKLFATAFLGSGLLFVAMLFAAAANVGALLTLYDGPGTVSLEDVRFVGAVSTSLLATFGVRMAAVFTMVVTNLGRRAGIVPRWLVAVGYVVAVVLLLAPPQTVWAVLLFPIWVLLLSLHILVSSFRSAPTPSRA
ncbi:hypothetical protein [Humibacillus xanthopallidus]|uniref:hypothetical protein n=1 Tax=Humibacillus xanthopallidus TaxID=412689 RepID=UPI00384B962D